MTKVFTYWSNKQFYHEKLLLKIEAESILIADSILMDKLGFDPIKSNWISVCIEEVMT